PQQQTSGVNAGKYCITDGQAFFGCFDTQALADAARAKFSTVATTEYCLQGTGATNLPCFPTKAGGDAALAGISVKHETTQYCVLGSSGANLGCYLNETQANVALQQTGQGRVLQIIGTTARLEERE